MKKTLKFFSIVVISALVATSFVACVERVLSFEGKTLSNGTVGVAYSQQLEGTGADSISYALASGSTLPAGLSLSGSTISGTPLAAVSDATFTVVASAEGYTSAEAIFTLTIGEGALAYSGGEFEVGYNRAADLNVATATGTSGVITYAVTEGELPDGLTLNSNGAITGTPTVIDQEKTFTVTASAVDCASASAEFTVTVTTPSLPFMGATLPIGEQNAPYEHYFAVDGYENATFALDEASALPDGLTLSSDGLLSGTPTVMGQNFTFTVVASLDGYRDTSAVFTMNIRRATAVETEGTISGFVVKPLTTAYAYGRYVATNAVTGSMQRASNDALISYALADATQLPDCFELSPNGTLRNIAAIPTSAIGVHEFDVVASANLCPSVTVTFTLTVAQAQITADRLITATQATAGVAYSYSFAGVPGVPWEEEEGEETVFTFAVYNALSYPLPTGLVLSADGVLSGTPARSERLYSFTIEISAEGLTSARVDVNIAIRDQIETVENGRFEAEYADLTGVQGGGSSSQPIGEGMIQPSGETGAAASNNAFVGYTLRSNIVIPFRFNVSADVTGASLTVALASEVGFMTLTPSSVAVRVDGVAIPYGSIEIDGTRAENSGFSAIQTFTVTNALSLTAGDHTIEFCIIETVTTSTGAENGAPALDYIEIGNFGNAALTWQPQRYNMNRLADEGAWANE